ncbi:MAG: TlpA family protein disulfide reductase, partial [Myxococcales bacterium]
SPLVGRAAPPFTLAEVASGEPLSLERLRGKPVVLNFWATWCQPCIMEHRVLHHAAQQLGDRVQFVGVVYEDESARILDFLARNGSGYPTLVDLGGKTAIAYGVYGVPETFFIDPSGKIIEKYEGPLSPPMLQAKIRSLLEAR